MQTERGNKKLYNIDGTFTETTWRISKETAFSGFFLLHAETRSQAGNLIGKLTETDGKQSIIQGYLNIITGLLNFEKTYVDEKSNPRRLPINYSFVQDRKDIGFWMGSFFLHEGERKSFGNKGFEPNGYASCHIQLVKDKVIDNLILGKIPEDFDIQKRQRIANYHYLKDLKI